MTPCFLVKKSKSPDTLDVACRLQVVDADPVRSAGEPRRQCLAACAGLPIVKSPYTGLPASESRRHLVEQEALSTAPSDRLPLPVGFLPVILPLFPAFLGLNPSIRSISRGRLFNRRRPMLRGGMLCCCTIFDRSLAV